MNREDFLDVLKEQYAEEIHTAYAESCHDKKGLDWNEYSAKLTKLMKCARAEGLGDHDFFDLVRAEAPETWEKVSALFQTKKAA